MFQRNRKLFVLFTVVVVSLYLLKISVDRLKLTEDKILLQPQYSISLSQDVINLSNTQRKKQFLYLAQVAECLSSYHLQKDVLGNGTAHDVLVLSYKKTCKHNQHAHIEYIEAGVKTTWTSGRNFLYRFVKEGKYYQKYQYYIFMDEDVQLLNNHLLENNGFKLHNLTNSLLHSLESPWRKFENFLSFYEPAVGEVDTEGHSKRLLTRPLPLIIPPFLSAFGFDAMFNAFHVDALDNLLPYNETLDSKSWWASQQFMHCKIFFRYHAQMIIFLPLLAENSHHSTYPKGLNPINEICAEEYESAPLHIRRANATSHLMSVKDYKSASKFPYIAPPKTLKEEYKYFEQSFPSWLTS